MTKDSRKDDELNRIIAEWMGWTFHTESSPREPELYEPEHWTDQSGLAANSFFCEDMNAVHYAEEKWCEQRGPEDASHPRFLLSHALYNVTVPVNRQPVFANARQRAEALVKVIEEGKK